jgi:hypothetical protein
MPVKLAKGSSSPTRELLLEGLEPGITGLAGLAAKLLLVLMGPAATGRGEGVDDPVLGLGGTVVGPGLTLARPEARCSAMDFLTNRLSTPACL